MATVFTLKTNSKKVVFALDNLKREAAVAIERATRQGMMFYKGKVQKEQYSGRPGLNVQTGTLRRGWRVWSMGSIKGGNFAVKMTNNVIYGQIHDKSRSNAYAGKNRSVYMPVRTDVQGDFQKSGRNILIGKVSKELAILVERGLIT